MSKLAHALNDDRQRKQGGGLWRHASCTLTSPAAFLSCTRDGETAPRLARLPLARIQSVPPLLSSRPESEKKKKKRPKAAAQCQHRRAARRADRRNLFRRVFDRYHGVNTVTIFTHSKGRTEKKNVPSAPKKMANAAGQLDSDIPKTSARMQGRF